MENTGAKQQLTNTKYGYVREVPMAFDAAVERSREVFHRWKTTSFVERKALVMRAREIILADIDGRGHLVGCRLGQVDAELDGGGPEDFYILKRTLERQKDRRGLREGLAEGTQGHIEAIACLSRQHVL